METLRSNPPEPTLHQPDPHDNQPRSQPMTTTTSTSSNASAVEVVPYGTRSRNRPGTSRPNYAEDTEMDFEMTTPTLGNGSSTHQNATSASQGRQSSHGGESGQATSGNLKKTATANTGNWNAANSSAAKEVFIPGTSTFSANPNTNVAPPPSKKRKAAAIAHSNGASSVASPANQAVTRRTTATNHMQSSRESDMLTYEHTGAILNKDGKLVADDGTVISINDNIYLVCEPPGEPYYLCRVMEFIHTDSDNSKSRVDSLRVNWFYRPRDVQRYNNDSRLVYGTMHSDICPITSLRGKCQIVHRSEIDDLEEYRKQRDSFWFNQVHDRFIHRWYDVIPTKQVINVPEKVKRALDERWKFVVVEAGRGKELTSEVKSCKRCTGYCATNDSVECAVCSMTYHMNCVKPPLLKKPSRGFAWACGPCSRAQERKLEARRTPIIGEAANEDDEEFPEEEEDDSGANAETTAPTPAESITDGEGHAGTQAEIAIAKMWPMRYLGIHCRVEDALQYDDRAIYPRASSRLGPRHQANVSQWPGRPVELVKPAEIKKRYIKSTSHKKDAKLSKETIAALEADRAERAKRPKWVQDEPPGYVRRGDDHSNNDNQNTAKLLFKMPPKGVYSSRGEDDRPLADEALVDAYMQKAKVIAGDVIHVDAWHTNFLDKAVQLLYDNHYDAEKALKLLKKVDRRKDLREPELTKEEQKRFEEGVAKYGSELRSVRLHVKTVSHADIVRYYYLWKKTPKGREVWGSYGGRRGTRKKVESNTTGKLLDSIADDQDDSAFDNEKAVALKRGFQCKFCFTRHSRQWRRAPGVAPGTTVSPDGRANSKDKMWVALCQRCARLWRKYAVEWEEPDEAVRKMSQTGGRGLKRRIDQELRNEWAAANEAAAMGITNDSPPTPPTVVAAIQEPPKKRAKATVEKEKEPLQPPPVPVEPKKKPAPPPRPPTPPIVPQQPKFKQLPCAVCDYLEPPTDQMVTCNHCKLTVHRSCYGSIDPPRGNKWICDACRNDKKEFSSYRYECVLCPVKHTDQELVEPPKISHKKKTDREREKERLEKELAIKFLEDYRHGQRDKGRSEVPREALKRTADNNWVHVLCALFHPEPKFSNAKALEVVEGIGRASIPLSRYEAICKVCKTNNGACVNCHSCHAPVHVACAHNAGYTLGFDVSPVKSSRRDVINTYTLGGPNPETGSLAPVIFCREHSPKTIVHPLNEIVEDSQLIVLQLYAMEYKQADLTLTGTVRKANLVDQCIKAATAPVVATGNRRVSTTTMSGIPTRASRNSSVGVTVKLEDQDGGSHGATKAQKRVCATCNIDVSPKWWPIDTVKTSKGSIRPSDEAHLSNGTPNNVPSENAIIQSSETQTIDLTNSVNGTRSAAAVASAALSAVDGDTTSDRADSVQCNKCHWKKMRNPDPTPPPPEVQRSESRLTEGPPLSRSPSRQLPQAQPWMPATTPAPHGPPHLAQVASGWAPPPPPPLANGVPLHAQPHPHIPPPQVFHDHPLHPHPPSNGFIPAPAVPPVQGGVIRSPYHPPYNPPPLHLPTTNPVAGHTNGLNSPHVALHSPTYPGPAHPVRQTESPYTGPPQHHQFYGAHHGSPAPGAVDNRPSTPRDNNINNPGASASPSLHNLLHH
ncbi:hypothetical protein M501DRAFT_939594 [Patellaria atrata CBS 101060]|uniref:BAH-domain-containing protein n=1 Tax=Patellaria atrata CBS 101060 TaxID=1346257 RepID=A0A9P4VQG9_9PEZI|nr:hypothetical protein M501DRAFT_939594 [Patellaria atrata CBS 101060]